MGWPLGTSPRALRIMVKVLVLVLVPGFIQAMELPMGSEFLKVFDPSKMESPWGGSRSYQNLASIMDPLPNPKLFQDLNGGPTSLGYRRDPLWVMVKPPPQLQGQDFIFFETWGNDRVDFYLVRIVDDYIQTIYQAQTSGWMIDPSKRPVNAPFASFLVNGTTPWTHIILRIESDTSMGVNFFVRPTREFFTTTNELLLVTGIVSGIILGLVLLNLIVSVMLRSLMAVFFAGFVFFVGILILYLNGSGTWVFWPWARSLSPHILTISILLANTCNFIFAWSFLELPRCMPKTHRATKVFLILSWIGIPLVQWFDPQVIYQANSIYVLISTFVSLGLIIMARIGKAPNSQYFLLAWVLFFIIGVLPILSNFGILPHSFLTRNAIYFSYLFYTLLLSFIMVRQYRSLQNALAERTKSLEVLGSSLESQVRERTQELEQAQRKAIAAEKLAALGRMVAGVSHELNTPLGNAKVLVGLLEAEAKTIRSGLQGTVQNGPLQRFLGVQDDSLPLLEQNIERSIQLVQSFKLIANDKEQAKPPLVDLHEQANLAQASCSLLSKDQPWNIEFQGEAIMLPIQLDHIQTIFVELLKNALQHGLEKTKPGSITLGWALTNQGPGGGQGILNLWCRDTGRGMDSKVLSQAFEPFFTTTRQDSVGMGLHILYNLATLTYQGSMDIESAPGQGTMVSMVLGLHNDE